MKKSLQYSLLLLLLISTNNIFSSTVEFNNRSSFSIEIESDIVGYPDPKYHVNKNSKKELDLGFLFLRGIKVNLLLGDQVVETVLEENLSQTLGFGDIKYDIFAELENKGREKFADEYTFEITLYLVREPKGIFYTGGIMDTSKKIKVRTKDFESFMLVKQENNQKENCCIPQNECCNQKYENI